jgi:uncharacterized protein (TIGR03083 family)
MGAASECLDARLATAMVVVAADQRSACLQLTWARATTAIEISTGSDEMNPAVSCGHPFVADQGAARYGGIHDMTDETLINSVTKQTRLLASWVRHADPSLPVPSCPDWTLADLVEHVGATQQWVATLIEKRIVDPHAAFAVTWDEAPAQATAWTDWLHRGAERAAAAFAGASAGADVFDPSGSNDGLTFWQRRLFGEVSVHRIDAALTVGRRYELAAPLAGVAIDDWLDTISSAGWAANVPGFADAMRGEGQRIAWVADDIDRAWILRRGDAALTLTREGGATVANTDVTVQGSAVDLLHVVSRRRPLGENTTCRVTGDRAELDHLIDNLKWVAA